MQSRAVNCTCTLELTLKVGTLACRFIVADLEGIVETLARALDLMMFCEFVAFAYISQMKQDVHDVRRMNLKYKMHKLKL